MKKAITLPQFVKDFPKDKCFVKEEYLRPNDVDYDYDKNLSYNQKLKYVGYAYKTITKLAATDDCIYYTCVEKRVNRRGKTFYPTSVTRQCIYIGKNEIRINISDSELIRFLYLLGINWFKDIDGNILCILFRNKTIFRRLITNRIYNEETLYKSALSCVYQLKDISWKTVRKYYEWMYGKDNWLRPAFVSLADLYYFTKNIDQTVDALYSLGDASHIYSDLLKSAIDLDEVVDFTWSPKRIAEEHKRQTQTLMAKEISAKKEVPIYDTTGIQFPFRLLNTEKDIFLEGKLMHHCLYNCYYGKITSHDYIAFHLDSPEDCTLGIWMYNDKPSLNQIYKKYDQRVSDETRKYAEDFIKSHEDDLIKLFNQKVKENKHLNCTIEDLPLWNVGLPY